MGGEKREERAATQIVAVQQRHHLLLTSVHPKQPTLNPNQHTQICPAMSSMVGAHVNMSREGGRKNREEAVVVQKNSLSLQAGAPE